VGQAWKAALLTIAMFASILWFALLLLIALVMSTGLADEPGDTNGFKRFLIFFPMVLPGLAGIVLCAMGFKRIRRTQAGGPRGFEVEGRSDTA
jgi:hypothetical protein